MRGGNLRRGKLAAGGGPAGSAGGQSSGFGPRTASSASCMAHHGETGCRPDRAAAPKSSQSTHLISATSAGSGSAANGDEPA